MKIIVLLLSINFCFAATGIQKKCEHFKDALTGESIHCISLSASGDTDVDDIKNLGKVSGALQEWIWLKDKMENVMKDNDKKSKILNSTINSFKAAKDNYPAGARDVKNMKLVETYQRQYEVLYEAAVDEKKWHFRRESCNTTGRSSFCSQTLKDDYELKIANARAKKLSILMTYPLLSNESIRETVENDVEFEENGALGEVKKRKELRRKNFVSQMLEGMDKVNLELNKRQSKWKQHYKKNNFGAKREIQSQSGKRKKGTYEKLFYSYEEENEDFQTDNTEMITELLMNSDLDKEMANPHIGRAICNIHNRNIKQQSIDDRNEMIWDGVLFVAPFFLGPIGGAQKLLSLGRVANWGMKGKYLVTGAIEAGLLANDYTQLSKTSDKCYGLQIGMLNSEELTREIIATDSNEFKESESNIERVSSCQEQLEDQTLIFFAGAAAGVTPFSSMYGYGKQTVIKLSKKSLNIVNRLSKTKDMNKLKGFLKQEGLSPGEFAMIKKDFDTFSTKNPTLKGDDLIREYKLHYQKKYNPVCKI